MLKTRKLERVVKGFSNHRRLQILELLENSPKLSVFEISDNVKTNYKTVSEHIRRLTIAGLVLKRNKSNEVLHILSPLGKSILKFLRTLE